MKTKLLAWAALAGAVALPLPVLAHTDFSFNVWTPGYVEAPPPVVYQPAPTYVVPAPGYYYGYTPAYGYYDPGAAEGWREHEWREHHRWRRERDDDDD